MPSYIDVKDAQIYFHAADYKESIIDAVYIHTLKNYAI